jgi:hypothetical protein
MSLGHGLRGEQELILGKAHRSGPSLGLRVISSR